MHQRLAGTRGFTLIELLIVVAIVGILAALAMAGYRMARIRAGEASAITALQSINQAQMIFSQTCGNQRYAPTLTALGLPSPATGQPFLSPDLTAADIVSKSGYRFVMSGTPATDDAQSCVGVAPVTSYLVTADPIQVGIGGLRFFGTNTDRAIFADAESFVDNMPETGAPGHGSELQ